MGPRICGDQSTVMEFEPGAVSIEMWGPIQGHVQGPTLLLAALIFKFACHLAME